LANLISGETILLVDNEVRKIEDYLKENKFKSETDYMEITQGYQYVNFGYHYDIENQVVVEHINQELGQAKYKRIKEIVNAFKFTFPIPAKNIVYQEDTAMIQILGDIAIYSSSGLNEVLLSILENMDKSPGGRYSNLNWHMLLKYLPLYFSKLYTRINELNESYRREGSPRYFVGEMLNFNPENIILFTSRNNPLKSPFSKKIMEGLNAKARGGVENSVLEISPFENVGFHITGYYNIIIILVKEYSSGQPEISKFRKGILEFFNRNEYNLDTFRKVSISVEGNELDNLCWDEVQEIIHEKFIHHDIYLFKK